MTLSPINWQTLPPRLMPHTAAQASDPIYRNFIRHWLHCQTLVAEGKAANFQAVDIPAPTIDPCPDCHGTRRVLRGFSGRIPQYGECQTCREGVLLAEKQTLRATINRLWHIPQRLLLEAKQEWFNRPGATGGNRARIAQQQIIDAMPNATSLFLFGREGTGKTRLGLEVASVAREMQLGAIYKTLEEVRRIIQDRDNYERRDLATTHLYRADVVVLDECDHAAGPAIQEWLLELLNQRYAADLTTVIIVNDENVLLAPVRSRLKAERNIHVDLRSDPDARGEMGHGVAQ